MPTRVTASLDLQPSESDPTGKKIQFKKVGKKEKPNSGGKGVVIGLCLKLCSSQFTRGCNEPGYVILDQWHGAGTVFLTLTFSCNWSFDTASEETDWW